MKAALMLAWLYNPNSALHSLIPLLTPALSLAPLLSLRRPDQCGTGRICAGILGRHAAWHLCLRVSVSASCCICWAVAAVWAPCLPVTC